MQISITRKRLVTAAIAAGALIGSAGIASAVTGSTDTSPSAPATGASPGATTAPGAATAPAVDNSNKDPKHEAGESTQREADETAGKMGHGGGLHGRSNTDPAHEATESPARKAQEATNDAAQPATLP